MPPSFFTHRDAGLHRAVPWSGLFLSLAIVAWVAPVFFGLATKVWTMEQGAQGLIILVTGLWLLFLRLRQVSALRAPARLGVAVVALVPCLLAYMVATMVNMMTGALLAT